MAGRPLRRARRVVAVRNPANFPPGYWIDIQYEKNPDGSGEIDGLNAILMDSSGKEKGMVTASLTPTSELKPEAQARLWNMSRRVGKQLHAWVSRSAFFYNDPKDPEDIPLKSRGLGMALYERLLSEIYKMDGALMPQHYDLNGSARATSKDALKLWQRLSEKYNGDEYVVYASPVPDWGHRPAEDNPSKGFLTIVAAKDKYGGWGKTRGNERTITVLAGPYTGTYVWTGLYASYYPKIASSWDSEGKSEPLARWQNEKTLAILEPITRVVHEALMQVGPQYKNVFDEESEEYRRLTALSDEDLLKEHLEKHPYSGIGGHASQFKSISDLRKWYVSRGANNANPTRSINSTATIAAERLYILSQCGDVPIENVIRDIKEQPKRILSIYTVTRHGYYTASALQIPTVYKDRRRFSKVLLSTWSLKNAIKKIFPNVEGRLPEINDISDYREIRYALNKVPGWEQKADTFAPPQIGAGYGGKVPTRRSEGTAILLRTAQDYRQQLKISQVDFRVILKTLTPDQISLLKDVLDRIPNVLEQLGETVEGRRVINNRERKDWRALVRNHDFVMAIPFGYGNDTISEKDALAFHDRAKEFAFPPGVRPLTTAIEFANEGKEMHHCVSGYFWQRKSWCFAFQAEDGTRATLELSTRGDQRQFYGVGNSSPSSACLELLQEFKRLNSERLKAMKDGTALRNPDWKIQIQGAGVVQAGEQQVRQALADMDKSLLSFRGSLRVLPAAEYKKYPLQLFRIWCSQRGFYGLPSKETIDWLRNALTGYRAIEIGSGNGAFGRALGVPRTDNCCQARPELKAYYQALGQATVPYESDVEPIDALDAVRKYKPTAVFGVWVTQWLDPNVAHPPGAEGSVYGIKEREIINLVDLYIVVGNLNVHGKKDVFLNVPKTHTLTVLEAPWLVSRSADPSADRIFIWKRK